MPTVVLDAYSKAYPSITNRIRASVFLETDPFALVASIIDTTVGHPARVWHFPGLPRANYGFSLDEIDSGGAVVANLALFSVVPSQIDGTLVRDDEQIKVGTTPGFDSGLNSVFFDGGEVSPGINRPNYIGWDIVPSELTGRGILVRGLDYSWDSVTGHMVWLQPLDVLQENTWYNIHFNPILNPSGGSVPTVNDFSSRIVTSSETLLQNDFGNTIIAEPSGNYIELTLPDITTVPQGRPLSIEVVKAIGSSVQCVKVIPNGADEINWLNGSIYIMNNESVEIYRLRRPDMSNEWRVRNADGNFKNVGMSVSEDCVQASAICKQLLDGSSKDKFQYARIYNEFVLSLPPSQVCNYDDWGVGNNKYLFSLANSSNPLYLNKFKFPDRRGLHYKNNNSGKAGDYEGDQMKQFWPPGMTAPCILDIDGTNTETSTDPGPSPNIRENNLINTSLFGDEVRVKSCLINKYVLI